MLALEQYSDSDLPWSDLIVPGVIGLVAIAFLIWLVPYLRRALVQGKVCLDQSTTAVNVTREAIEVTRESIKLQRETNRLLMELNQSLKNPPL